MSKKFRGFWSDVASFGQRWHCNLVDERLTKRRQKKTIDFKFGVIWCPRILRDAYGFSTNITCREDLLPWRRKIHSDSAAELCLISPQTFSFENHSCAIDSILKGLCLKSELVAPHKPRADIGTNLISETFSAPCVSIRIMTRTSEFAFLNMCN